MYDSRVSLDTKASFLIILVPELAFNALKVNIHSAAATYSNETSALNLILNFVVSMILRK